MRRLLALSILAWTSATLAQDPPDPIIRVSLEPETVNVGEAAALRITVLAPTWFPQPPEFPSFEVPNALVRLPPNSSRATSERIGRNTWAGVTRRYEVYPLIGARFRLGGDSVRVTVADPGNPARQYDLPIPDIELRAVVPPGAASLDPFIAGTRFEVTRQIDGELDGLEAGSAVVVTYTAELDGLHAMFIPSLAPDLEQAGLSVYTETPQVDDSTPARREEKVTLVFETGGDFTVPASGFEWWNTSTDSVETIVLDAATLSVVGPLPMEPVGVEPETAAWRGRLAGVALLLGAALLARFAMPRLRGWYRRRETRVRASESFAFKSVLKAVRRDNSRAIHEALLAWAARLDPAIDSRRFAASYGDPELLAAIDSLSRSRYGESAAGDAGNHDLGRLLAAARQRYLAARRAGGSTVLPRLNP